MAVKAVICGRRLSRAWGTSVEQWIKAVALSTLFLMSLMQSITFFAKFMDPPKTSSITMRRLQAEDTPWITICPVPAFDVERLAEFLNEARKNDTTYVDEVGFTGKQLSLVAISNKSKKTVEGFLNEVAVPLWAHNPACIAADVHGVKERDCNILQNDYYTSEIDLWIDDVPSVIMEVKLNDPMVAHTAVGSWETEFVALTRPSIVLCSTLKPNFTLDPTTVENVKITMNPDIKGPPRPKKEILQKGIDEGKFKPSYAVFLTGPKNKPFTYHFVNEREKLAGRNIACGERVEVRPRLKRFQFMDTPDNPCNEQDSETGTYHECVTQCFEAEYLGATFRLPGFRNNATAFLASNFKPVPVCNSLQDYKNYNEATGSKRYSKVAMRKVLTHCESKVCKKPCAVLEYEFLVNTFEGMDPSTNVSQFWANCGSKGTTIEISAGNPYATVMHERNAYDVHQLVSDLGGSWGLFLGLSIVNVLGWVHEAIRYFTVRFE